MFETYSGEVTKKLSRFDEFLTSIEVYFADENRGKQGIDDKRCTIEIKVKNMPPEAVTHNANTLKHAFSGSIDKARKLLDSRIGKLQSR